MLELSLSFAFLLRFHGNWKFYLLVLISSFIMIEVLAVVVAYSFSSSIMDGYKSIKNDIVIKLITIVKKL
jgi:hypothetical protein